MYKSTDADSAAFDHPQARRLPVWLHRPMLSHTSYHPLHAPIIIHHAPPLIVHHSIYHAPTMAYHPTYHPASYHSTYHPSTSYHSSYHGSPTTYHRTSSYRHYLMTESPAKLRAARVAMWGSSALVLIVIVV